MKKSYIYTILWTLWSCAIFGIMILIIMNISDYVNGILENLLTAKYYNMGLIQGLIKLFWVFLAIIPFYFAMNFVVKFLNEKVEKDKKRTSPYLVLGVFILPFILYMLVMIIISGLR